MFNPFARQPPIELTTPLSPEECLRQIEAATDPDMSFSPSRMWRALVGKRPVHFSPRRSGFVLRRRIRYGNGFQRLLYVELEPQPEGSRLTAKFRMRTSIRIYLACMLGLFVFLLGVGLTADTMSVNGVQQPADLRLIVQHLAFMWSLMVAIVGFCLWLCSGDKAILLDFLRETIGMQERKISESH